MKVISIYVIIRNGIFFFMQLNKYTSFAIILKKFYGIGTYFISFLTTILKLENIRITYDVYKYR